MFEPPEKKNRRMTPWELEQEREIANIFKRPMRYFLFDKPFYPYVPTDETQMVNFDLNFKE